MSFSVADYDKSFVQKVQSVYPNTRYAFAEWALKESAKTNQEQLAVFPLISLYRLGYIYNRGMYSFADKFLGRDMWQNQSAMTSTTARTIPVSITYQIDIESNLRETMDDLTSELIMFMEISPVLEINPESINAPEPFRFDIVYEDGPIDNTDIMSMETSGRIYRNTLFYVVPEARLLVKNNFNLVQQLQISVQVDNTTVVIDN